jgi:L-asparagine transporter-like permease
MPVNPINNGGDGVAFLVSAGLVYECIAKACSSPQTAELNAEKRAETLMKWVNIGTVEAIAFVCIAVYFEPKHRNAIIAGGALAAVVTYGEYIYAKQSGLASKGEPTETW